MGQALTGVELHLELEDVLDDGGGFWMSCVQRVVWFKVCTPALAGQRQCCAAVPITTESLSHGQGAFDKAQIQGRKDKEEA